MNEEVELYMDDCKERMQSSLKHLEDELTKIRAGKASPDMLKSIKVDYYGQITPLTQIANVGTADARTIVIQPWEKAMIVPIEKEIMKSNLGFNPVNNGEIIRINVPDLTEERRIKLAKQVKNEGENAKISIRNIRRDVISAIKDLEKEGLSEDQSKDAQTKVQDLTNNYSTKVDKFVEAKEKDLMSL